MISMIVGKLHGADENALIIFAGGIGYRVVVSERDSYALCTEKLGQEVKLLIRAIYREGEPHLFGFIWSADQTAFDRIRKVDGCGPGVAMRILSVMTGNEFGDVVAEKRIADLLRVKGVGRKTAQKLVEEA
jgi:holliday junction DNA helicase RuvA